MTNGGKILNGAILVVDATENSEMRRVLEAAGLNYLFAENSSAALAKLSQKKIHILLGRIHQDTENFSLFDQARKIAPDTAQIAIIDERLEEFFPELLLRAYPRNLIADNKPLNLKELIATVRKLITKDIFGLTPYGITTTTEAIISRSDQKDVVILEALDFFKKSEVAPRLLEKVSLILNELLTNAIYDAPVNDRGQQKFVGQNRGQPLLLKVNERPVLQYGINATTLGVSVSDPFGSFKSKTFFSYVNRCFAEKKILNEKGKGAGFGLFLVFKSLDQLVINVESGKKTEVIAMIDYRSSIRELKKRRHSFHYFQLGNI